MTLIIGIIALSIVMLAIVTFISRSAMNRTFNDKKKVQHRVLIIVVCLILWHLYHFALGKTEVLLTFELPPRFVLFLIAPAFIFTGVFIYKNRNNDWIKNIPPHWLTFYQTFRIVLEVLLFLAVGEGVLHPIVTLEGYNFDIYYACTAPMIGIITIKRTPLAFKIAKAWNYFGLAVIASIIFVFFSATFAPSFWGSEVPLMPLKFATYPYMLVAGFLMPSAVFMHILSIVNLNKNKQ